MSEEDQDNVVVAEDQVEPQEVPSEPEPENQDPVKEEPKKADHNWAQVRDVLHTQKNKIDELEKKLNEKPEVDEFEGVDPGEYITFEQHQKLNKKKDQKESKEISDLKDRLRLMENKRHEERMRGKHEDYDYVIENFGIPLVQNNPRLAEAIRTCDDWAEMAYNMAKATPEYQKAMTQKSPKAEKVKRNTERPTSANAAGSSLKNQASYFAEMSPSEVWKKSQEFARRA